MSSTLNTWDEPFLPWVESENDRRFKRILLVCIILSCILGAIVPFLPVPEPEKKDLKTVSPRLAKLITEIKKQPPPPPPPPKPVEKRETIKKPEPKKKEPTKKEVKAQAKAANTGLVALSSELSSLRDSFDMADFSDQPLKKSSDISKETFNKNVIASNATRESGGINTSKLSRNTGGSKLESRSTTSVKSELASNTQTTAKRTASGKLIRSDSEIEKVFQNEKGAIFSIYNRALRKDPGLQGKVILELTIAPNGSVTNCKILSSDLRNEDFERKLIARIKLFKFKPSNADVMTVKYPIDFLPS